MADRLMRGDAVSTDQPRRAESAITRARPNLFREMADALPVCIAYVDAEQRYRFVNSTYTEWHGLEKSMIEGRTVRELLGDEIYAQVEGYVTAALAGVSQSFEYLAKYRSGKPRQVIVEYVPYRDPEDGCPDGFFALISDITERKQNEERIAELLDRFRAVTLAAFHGFAVSDNGIFIEVSDRYAESLGYTPEELIGKSYVDVVPVSEHRNVERRIMAAEEGVYESIARRRDGSTFPIEICGVNLRVRGRNIRVVAARDISEKIALERQVAEISHREQTRIGHDLHDSLGQELTGISLVLADLRRQLEAEHSPHIARLDRVSQLVKRSIRLTRTLARGLAPVFDNEHGLADALDRLAAETRQLHEVECRHESFDAGIDWDVATATQVYRVAQEAVANAVRHSGASRIDVQTFARDGEFNLLVCDDGSGPAAITAAEPGMGMQTMSYRARLLGGQLDVGRGADGGTRVLLQFPVPG